MIQLRRQHILMRDIAVTLKSEDAWVEEKLKAMDVPHTATSKKDFGVLTTRGRIGDVTETSLGTRK